MAVTIQDVARQANVSISTVSRVLNGTARVRQEKRVRVEAAVRELGYAPNPNAQSLLNHKTCGIGVILPYVTGEFFSDLLLGIDQTAQDSDYFLLISTSHRNENDIRRALQTMHKRVDGLLIMAPDIQTDVVRSIVQASTPVVFMNTHTGQAASDAILFDNYQAFYDITQHLLDLGHRHVAVVHGPSAAFDAQERLRGFRSAVAAFPEPIEVLEVDEAAMTASFLDAYSLEAGYAAGQRIVDQPVLPTAILAPNDQNALGVLHALHEAGLRVPDDVSVTGFDNVSSSRYAIPALTTVGVPVQQMGRTATRRLLAQIEAEEPRTPAKQTLPVELVIRNSTAPPRLNGS